MTILVEMDYLEYAANTMYGKEFCDLPYQIRDAIEEYFDGLNLSENSNANPDNMWVNSFTEADNVKLFIQLMMKKWTKKKWKIMLMKN